MNQLIQEYFAAYDVVPNVIFHANQLMTILSFIRSGQAAGMLPEELIRDDPEIISYELKDLIQKTPIYLVYKTNTKTVEELRKTVIRYMSQKQQ